MTEPLPTTPSTWRLAAGLALGGAAALGYAASARGGLPRRLVMSGLALGVGSTIRVAAASRRPPIPPGAPPLDADAGPPTFSVVVAARDEAAVLPRLIGDLARQDYRTATERPLFELIVIDDRSVDGTPQAALRAAGAEGLGAVTRLVRRVGDELADGKGAALSAVPPETCHGDVIVVLDADARVGPTFLSTLATYIRAGAEAVTVRRRVLQAGSSSLAGAQADEQLADGEIQRGRWALGGCSEFRGNGIVLRRAVLIGLGGYALTAAALGFDALRWEARPDGGSLSLRERLRRAVRLAAFGVIWLAAVPAALLRLALRGGPVQYDKMAHGGGGESPLDEDSALTGESLEP